MLCSPVEFIRCAIKNCLSTFYNHNAWVSGVFGEWIVCIPYHLSVWTCEWDWREKLGRHGRANRTEKLECCSTQIELKQQLATSTTATTDYDEFSSQKLFFRMETKLREKGGERTPTDKFPQQSQWNLCVPSTQPSKTETEYQTSRKKGPAQMKRLHSVCWSIKSKLNYGLFGRLYLMPFWNWVFLRNGIENFHLPFGNFFPLLRLRISHSIYPWKIMKRVWLAWWI